VTEPPATFPPPAGNPPPPLRSDRWWNWFRAGRRAWFRRTLLLGLIAATVYLVGDRFGNRVRISLDVLHQQQACMEHRDPPGTLVVGDGPAVDGRRPPTTRPLDWGVLAPRRAPMPPVIPTNGDRAYAAFEAALGDLARYRSLRTVPPVPNLPTFRHGGTIISGGIVTYYSMSRGWSVEPPFPRPVVFLHARRAVGSQDRMIVVRLRWNADNERPVTAGGYWSFEAAVIRPATASGDAACGPWVVARVPKRRADGTGTFMPEVAVGPRVYAGQSDPADPSRFTIGAEVEPALADPEMEAGIGALEGHLLPDDTVTWAWISSTHVSR
jgi:hypothetical protein